MEWIGFGLILLGCLGVHLEMKSVLRQVKKLNKRLDEINNRGTICGTHNRPIIATDPNGWKYCDYCS
jgi:hypothetical protein